MNINASIIDQRLNAIIDQIRDQAEAVSRPLPHYLNQQYALQKRIAGKRTFLRIMLKDTASFRPAIFEKYLHQIMAYNAFDGFCLIAPDFILDVTEKQAIKGQGDPINGLLKIHNSRNPEFCSVSGRENKGTERSKQQ